MSPKTPPSGSGQQYIMPTDQAYARYKWRVPPTYPPGSSIKEIGRDEQQRWALHVEALASIYIVFCDEVLPILRFSRLLSICSLRKGNPQKD